MYWPPGNIDPRLPQRSGRLAKAVPSVRMVSGVVFAVPVYVIASVALGPVTA
ncbi:hypothetical protein BH09ACT7_BH09ACT7_53800 [soil metagenome]